MKKVIVALLIVIMICGVVEGGANPVVTGDEPAAGDIIITHRAAEPPGESQPVVGSPQYDAEVERIVREATVTPPQTSSTTEEPLVKGAIGRTLQAGTTATIGGTGVKYYVDPSTGSIYPTPGKAGTRREVPEAVARAAETNGGITKIDTYQTSTGKWSTYTYNEQTDVQEGIEADYKITTTVSIEDHGDYYVRNVDQKTEERTGILERGQYQYADRTTVSTVISTKDDKGNIVKNREGKPTSYMSGQMYTSYDENGKPTTISGVGYKYSPKWGKSYQSGASVDRVDENGDIYTVWTMDEDGNEKYAKDKAGKDIAPTAAEKKAIETERVRSVNNGMQGLNAFYKLGFARSMGRFMKAYDEYAGLRQYSSIGLGDYDKQVKERKAKIQQEFCYASGVTNCIVSTICSKKFDIVPGNTLAGRGPGGQFVTSARINGERSLAVELEGMKRQQLIDMFGNTTVISGRRVNLTDLAFDTKTLGKLKLRLYHVQFTITNNAKYEMSYNIKFKRGEPGSTTSYGTPVKEAKWYPADKKLAVGAAGADELYKWSPGEYSDVCLIFSPPLPSGSVTGKPQMVNDFCVPFTEYTGGPTEIAATLEEALAQGTQEEQVTGTPGEMV